MGLLSQAPMADCAFVCTLGDDHTAPALKAMELGYHLLPEKPMSNTEEEGCSIVQMANQTGRTLAFCHVLHYTPFYVTIKRLIDYGEIGEVTTINKSGSSALFWGGKEAHSSGYGSRSRRLRRRFWYYGGISAFSVRAENAERAPMFLCSAILSALPQSVLGKKIQ